MRSDWDALRSVKRWVAMVLPEWEVRLDDEAISFPYARVDQTTPTVVSPGSSAKLFNVAMGLGVACYPEPQESVEKSKALAYACQNRLLLANRRGVGNSRPARIPLYNYNNVGLDEPATEDHRFTSDFMRVVDFSVQPLPDPGQENRIAVNCGLRVTWRRVGLIEESGPIARAVRFSFPPETNVRISP